MKLNFALFKIYISRQLRINNECESALVKENALDKISEALLVMTRPNQKSLMKQSLSSTLKEKRSSFFSNRQYNKTAALTQNF